MADVAGQGVERAAPVGPEALAEMLATRSAEILDVLRFQALGPDRIIDFACFGEPVRLYLPYALRDLIQKTVLQTGGFYEGRLLERVAGLVPRGGVVLDAGANIGNHTVFFALICRAGLVHAFEPVPAMHAVLLRNLEINGLRNVVPHRAALGAAAGRAGLQVFRPNNMGSAVMDFGGGDFPVTTIDALELGRLDLLKIDVEGAQTAVLAGAEATLARCRPRIMIELRARTGEVEAGNEVLSRMGYRMTTQLSRHDYIYEPA
jgi:FkbM family methyltransferase